MFKETFITLILFNVIRYFGFGFHAGKSYQCLICSIFNFICIPYIFLNINLSEPFVIIICFICLLNYLLYAPADTIKRPLPNKKKRFIRKLLTILTAVIYISAIYFIKSDYLTGLIISAMSIQAIVINPLTYKIFGQPYRNYKTYLVA